MRPDNYVSRTLTVRGSGTRSSQASGSFDGRMSQTSALRTFYSNNPTNGFRSSDGQRTTSYVAVSHPSTFWYTSGGYYANSWYPSTYISYSRHYTPYYGGSSCFYGDYYSHGHYQPWVYSYPAMRQGNGSYYSIGLGFSGHHHGLAWSLLLGNSWSGGYGCGWGSSYSYPAYSYGSSLGLSWNSGRWGVSLGLGNSWASSSFVDSYYSPAYSYYSGPTFSSSCSIGLGSSRSYLSTGFGYAPRYTWVSDGYCYTSPWTRNHYHYYNAGANRYRVYQPYYYAAPAWCGATYAPGYGYRSELVRYVYDRDAYANGYADGYEDGENASPYRTRSRVRLQRDEPEDRRAFVTGFDELMDKGIAAFHDGDYDGATGYFKDATVAKPGDAGAKMNLAQAAFAAGRYSLAAFTLRRALEQDGQLREKTMDPRDNYTDRAVYQHQLDRLAGDAALTPTSDTLFVLGWHRFHTGDHKGAAAAFEDALKLDAKDEPARLMYEVAMRKLTKAE